MGLDAVSGQGGRCWIGVELEIDSWSLTIIPVNADITSNKSGGSVERAPVVEDWSATMGCHYPSDSNSYADVITRNDWCRDMIFRIGDGFGYTASHAVVESATLVNDATDVVRWNLTILGSSELVPNNV